MQRNDCVLCNVPGVRCVQRTTQPPLRASSSLFGETDKKQANTPMMAGDRVAEVMGGIQREWGRGSLVRWPEEASEQGTIKHCR